MAEAVALVELDLVDKDLNQEVVIVEAVEAAEAEVAVEAVVAEEAEEAGDKSLTLPNQSETTPTMNGGTFSRKSRGPQ